MQLTPSIRASYTNSWANMKVKPDRIPILTNLAKKFEANKATYAAIEAAIGVPWYFVAIVNERESGGRLDCYLGNGDPLNRVTTHVPAGRGPFANFSDGAIDALKLQGLDKWNDWSLEGLLFKLEEYNGWGYLGKNNSPYLWSYTNLYSQGKYVADGHYSASAVDQQPGCAAMLWQMIQLGIVPAPAQAEPPKPSDDIKWVQSALNKLGANLAVDGYAGVQTIAAIKAFQEEHDLNPDGIVGDLTRSSLKQELKSQDIDMSWLSTLFLNMLGSSQVQAMVRKLLTVAGTALLVKFGLDAASAGSIIGQIITALGGVVALGSSAFLSAQNASPNISNPTLIKPATPTA